MVVFTKIDCYKSFHIGILDIFMIFHQFAHRAVVHMVTHALLRLNLISIRYRYIIHLVAKTDNQHVLSIRPSRTDTHPNSNLTLSFPIFPMPYHYFAANSHSSTNMPELTIAMSRLIQVHEVHIHGVPRYLLVELGMKM